MLHRSLPLCLTLLLGSSPAIAGTPIPSIAGMPSAAPMAAPIPAAASVLPAPPVQAVAAAPETPPASGRAPAPAPPVYAVRGSAAKRYSIAAGKGVVSLLFDAPSGTGAAMTVLELQPGTEVPQHVHERSIELLYVLEGETELVIDGRKIAVGPGDAVRIPMNTLHQARVTGSRPLRAVQVYTPAGPEQRFLTNPIPAK
jgi:mannose-6-phosphate isomerase-like protein (cupin superfamily)